MKYVVTLFVSLVAATTVIGLILFISAFSAKSFSLHLASSHRVADDEEVYIKARADYATRTEDAFQSVSAEMATVSCENIAAGNTQTDELTEAAEIGYKFDKEREILLRRSNIKRTCKYVRRVFGFSVAPLSKEEKNFPLAYGLFVKEHTDQVLYMMSSVYHPQNLYCIAVDATRNSNIYATLRIVSKCFPNVIVTRVKSAEGSGDFAEVEGVLRCVKRLASAAHPWEYYQYLSSYDLPIKTNHELVRIFKRLNGSTNVELTEYQKEWLKGNEAKIPTGITLYESSISATFSRKTANFVATSAKVKEVVDFLSGTHRPHEALWATLAGNPTIGMPFSFNATKWLRMLRKRELPLASYYISRYHLKQNEKLCRGKMIDSMCVFGVGDVRRLLDRTELVAHKFSLEVEPAGFFCLFRRVRQRAAEGAIQKFDDKPYGQLPCAMETRNENVDNFSGVRFSRLSRSR